MMDMFRNGDKLLKAIDMMTDIIIHSILHNPMVYNAVTVGFPLHKGADGWMSPKQYEKFYWPSLKKVMDAFINEGLICQLFAEGSYNTRLEVVRVIFRRGALSGGLIRQTWRWPKRFWAINSPSRGMFRPPHGHRLSGGCEFLLPEAHRYLRGGRRYIMAAGCIAENPKLENLRAMMEAIREYGVYR